MTDDYIKRSDALKAARYYKNRREENHVPPVDDIHLTEYQLLAQAINSIPAADVEPVRRGRWEDDPHHHKGIYYCSVCRRHIEYYGKGQPYEFFPYCHCGAKMMEEQDDA